MCLGVPGKIIKVADNYVGTVDVNGNQMDISLRLTPEAQPGEYVLIHAGFAMEIIDADIAAETISYMEEMGWYDR
ncbi:MAG: HypC/HybG/HupF family hydrogenase formation chaperone [Syntrophomonadaceae bacterium]|nr:HypC/HybG/HupF family hydrogenase formation chaperone [Syntrophomonadaceae bacterium]